MFRLIVAFLAALGGAVLAPAATEVPSGKTRPNIVLILVDDLGYGDLSSYGATDLESPAIDRLGERGMRFTQFYANSCVCSPTRAALLSGRHPEQVGVPGVIRTNELNSWGDLADDTVLLPEMLRRRGYHTAMVGKWHLGLAAPDRPIDRGFDYFKGFLGDMMDDYYHHRRHGINYLRENEQVITPEGHATDLFSDWAVDYIASRTESNAPFFLYLAYNAPHTPIQPPEDWVRKVMAREPGLTEKRARLVALIEHMDAGIGRVVDALSHNGYDEDTLVVFSSDNGGQLNVDANNGPLRAGKGTMYEGGLRVPTVAVWPGVIAAGSATDYAALSMDLFPTLLDVANIQPTHFIEGVSFLPTLLGEKQAWQQRDLFFIRREGGRAFSGKTIDAMRRGPWKLVHNSPFAPMELYNLEEDPFETTNLADSETAVFNKLSTALREHTRQGGKVPWTKR